MRPNTKRMVLVLFAVFFLNLAIFISKTPAASAVNPFTIDTETGLIIEKYTVQRGDTLSQIAVQHKLSVRDLIEYNRLKEPNIFIGQHLLIPLKPNIREPVDEVKGTSAKALVAQGDKHRSRQEYGKAMAAYSEALAVDAYTVDALYGLGYAHLKMHAHAEAVDAFVTAVKIDPYNPRSHFNLGLVYTQLKEKAPAFEQYRILKILDEKYATRLLIHIDGLR